MKFKIDPFEQKTSHVNVNRPSDGAIDIGRWDVDHVNQTFIFETESLSIIDVEFLKEEIQRKFKVHRIKELERVITWRD